MNEPDPPPDPVPKKIRVAIESPPTTQILSILGDGSDMDLLHNQRLIQQLDDEEYPFNPYD